MSNVIEQLINVPVGDIIVPEMLLRDAQTTDEKYLTLKGSITDNGVRTALLVSPGVTPGTYILSDGMQRLSISKELGLETVPCRVEDMTESEGYLAQLEMNLTKVDVKPSQYSAHLTAYAHKFPAATIPNLARKLNVSADWLRDRLDFKKLAPLVQTAVDEGQMTMSKAILLKNLDPAIQEQFIEKSMALDQESFARQVGDTKKELAKAKREGRAPQISEFIPEPRSRSKSDLIEELEKLDVIPGLVSGLDGADAGIAVLKWVLRLDPASVAAGKQAWEDAKAAKEEKDARKKAEREAKLAAAADTVRG